MAPKEREPEPSAAPAGLPRSIYAVAILSLLVYVAVMTLFKMSNNDIWIHLKTGEYVLKNGWVPIKDPYSFIAADHDYVAHEWLAGVLFYLVYGAAGVTGLIWFKSAVLAASNALLYGAARSLRGRMSVILPAFTCLLYVASARYLERPHIFSYLMAALDLFLFFRFREGGRRRMWLYLLIPAQIVWANLHGGWVQGMAMIAVFAFGEFLIFLRARRLGLGADRALAPRDVGLLAALVPACLAATLVNPYGWRIMTFPFELTRLKLFMQQIYEWQPPYSVSYNSSTMFFFYLIHVAALCLFFFLSQRDRTRAKGGSEALGPVNAGLLLLLAVALVVLAASWTTTPPSSGDLENARELRLHNVLYLVLGIFCAFTVANLRSVDFTQAGLFALFYYLSLQHNRAVTDSAMATFPILVAAASGFLDRRAAERGAAAARTGPKRGSARPSDEMAAAPAALSFVDRSAPAAVWAGSILMLGVSAHAAIFTYYFDFKGAGREKGFAIADNMPTCAVDFVEKHHITGNAFVSYAYAAMLIHRMHPAVKVNMDSRNDVYGEDLYREFLSALRSPEGMKTYLERHPIDFFIMGYGDRLPATFDYLESTHAWAPVYYDDRGFILLKRSPANEALIRELELRVLRPSVMGAPEISAANAALVLDEADRCIASCPKALMPYFFKSKALLFLGRVDDALAASGEVLKRDPDNVLAYADMAMTYAATGRTDKAIEMYEAALRVAPDFTLARENLRRLRGF
ncbi:MAG: tetratricopeptide repeat protein [Acidobacteria bacterium]|nr:tetratricopeptide repeat protein [Acidobacteriota bacterium]